MSDRDWYEIIIRGLRSTAPGMLEQCPECNRWTSPPCECAEKG